MVTNNAHPALPHSLCGIDYAKKMDQRVFGKDHFHRHEIAFDWAIDSDSYAIFWIVLWRSWKYFNSIIFTKIFAKIRFKVHWQWSFVGQRALELSIIQFSKIFELVFFLNMTFGVRWSFALSPSSFEQSLINSTPSKNVRFMECSN